MIAGQYVWRGGMILKRGALAPLKHPIKAGGASPFSKGRPRGICDKIPLNPPFSKGDNTS